MSKLVLHIGAHKTATSTIQQSFRKNSRNLEGHSVIYPLVHPNGAHHVMAAPWLTAPEIRAGVSEQNAYDMWDKLSVDYAHTDKTVFISSETFGRILPDKVDFKELSDLVRKFDEVKILYVMREQASFFQSIYLQVTKNNENPPNLTELLDVAFNEHTPTGVSLNHEFVFDMLLGGFDNEQIHFAEFEAIKNSKKGIFGFFLEQCGVQAHPTEIFSHIEPTNISSDPLAQLIGYNMRPSKKIDFRIVDIARHTIDDLYGKNARTSLLSREEIRKFRELFTSFNTSLMSRLHNKGEYLNRPIIKMSGKTVMRNNLTTDFWEAFARKLVEKIF